MLRPSKEPDASNFSNQDEASSGALHMPAAAAAEYFEAKKGAGKDATADSEHSGNVLRVSSPVKNEVQQLSDSSSFVTDNTGRAPQYGSRRIRALREEVVKAKRRIRELAAEVASEQANAEAAAGRLRVAEAKLAEMQIKCEEFAVSFSRLEHQFKEQLRRAESTAEYINRCSVPEATRLASIAESMEKEWRGRMVAVQERQRQEVARLQAEIARAHDENRQLRARLDAVSSTFVPSVSPSPQRAGGETASQRSQSTMRSRSIRKRLGWRLFGGRSGWY
ncbi:hypothetical protein GGF46_003578 [Coemansia sp. RSA 552]|nr:hypothetical protein GGF46_003578 [Coemansia sp. RSA 552]